MLDLFFGQLGFQSQLYLIGLAAALIPLIIHLSRSRRTRKMRFSTTRFFTDQFLRSYRMSRLKELLLLACRMALFALLAMALAQPLFVPRGRTALGGQGSRAVVLVIDNSASMGYTENGRTLLDRARQAAHSLLQQLHAGDRASVVLANWHADGPEVLFPTPTDQLNDVRQALGGIEVAALATDLGEAVRRAELIAQETSAEQREVYVFSDLQQSGWEAPDEKYAPSDTSRVSFAFVQIKPQGPIRNRAVTAVQYGAPRPMANVPFTIRPLVAVTGDDGRDVNVRLYVDGAKVGEQRLERQPNGHWALPRFTHVFEQGGWHSGYVEVDDTVLPQDNRRSFALEVLDSVKLLAVDGAPSRVPRLDELFFLRPALTAHPEGQKSPFALDTIVPAELARADLAKYPLVVLANVESLPEAAVEKLEDFVEAGGSILVFLGDRANPRFYNETLQGGNRRHGGLLPARLVRVEGKPAEGKEVATIGGADYDHPALAPFQDARFAHLVGRGVSFTALWRLEAEPASLLMKTDTGLPLLCEKTFGKGRVMLFASTCDRDWTSFPIRPVFLPWTHLLVSYLAQHSLTHQAFHFTGENVRLPASLVAPGAPVRLRKPGGATGTIRLSIEETPAFVVQDVTEPGVYTLTSSEQKAPVGLFAVNLDSLESDLTYLDDVLAGSEERAGPERKAHIESELQKQMHRPLVTYLDSPAELDGVGQRRQLWQMLLWAVLLIGLLEPWLANRISARLYGKPRAAPQPIGPAGALATTPRMEREPAPVEASRS